MNRLLLLPILVALVIVQATLLDHVRVLAVKPDLVFCAVIIAGLIFYLEQKTVLATGIAAGMLKDALAGGPFGVNTLLFPAWGLLAARLARKVSTDSFFFRGAFVLAAVILNDILNWIIYACLGRVIPAGAFLRIVLLESVYTALAAQLVFKVLKTLAKEHAKA